MSDELKHYGYGIVDKDGKPHIGMIDIRGDKRLAERAFLELERIGKNPPYRVVELFWKEEGESDWITNVATRNRELREERDKLLILLRATAKYTNRKPFNLTKEIDAILAKYPEGEL